MADFDIGLGSDSFIACLAIGALPVTGWQAVRLATAFGVCDATATLIGGLLPHAIPPFDDWMQYLICAALIGTTARLSGRLLYLVPVVLSLDNLVAGTPASAAPGVVVSSATMALAGLLLGGLWCRTEPDASRWAKPDPPR